MPLFPCPDYPQSVKIIIVQGKDCALSKKQPAFFMSIYRFLYFFDYCVTILSTNLSLVSLEA
jgi:hypothetical protein